MDSPGFSMLREATHDRKIPDPVFSSSCGLSVTSAMYDTCWLIRLFTLLGLPSPAIERIIQLLLDLDKGWVKHKYVVAFPVYTNLNPYLRTYSFILEVCPFCNPPKLNRYGANHIHTFSVDELVKIVHRGMIVWVLTLFARDFQYRALANKT